MTFPQDFTFPDQKVKTAGVAALSIAGLAVGHRVVVQAGGCIGLWPRALADYFAHVYTFEPSQENFACLVQNIAGLANVSASPSALGDTYGRVGLTRPKAQAGLWRVEGDGPIPRVALDDVLSDAAVDAIVLDVEGSEVAALRGAERLIAAHRPLLWFEYLHHQDAITDFLRTHGYTAPVPGLGADFYSVHTSRVH